MNLHDFKLQILSIGALIIIYDSLSIHVLCFLFPKLSLGFWFVRYLSEQFNIDSRQCNLRNTTGM